MSKQNIEESVESRVCFEELEDWVREKLIEEHEAMIPQ